MPLTALAWSGVGIGMMFFSFERWQKHGRLPLPPQKMGLVIHSVCESMIVSRRSRVVVR